MQGKVEICGVNTSKLKVLKNEETMELLRRTKEGDMEAREQLIAGNLRLVLSVIQKFSNRGENLDDLFQVKGHRQLQYRPGRALLHLRRTHDYRGDPPLPEGQLLRPGVPLHAGHGL